MADEMAARSGNHLAGVKRRRVDSNTIDDDEPAQTLPEKYKELQFDDATIVLQCPTASFRVHRSLFAAHSEVFRDMFALAQPGGKPDDVDILVVHLSDDAEKMYRFLKLLYFHVRPTEDDDEYFEKLLDIWELLRKYAFASISDYCEEALRTLFPQKLADFKQTSRIRSVVCQRRCDALRCIAMAKSFNLRVILPALYCAICQYFELWSPEDAALLDDWPTDPLVAITLFHGRHRLLKLKRDTIDDHLRQFYEQTPEGDGFHCGAKLRKVFFYRFTKPSTTIEEDYFDDFQLFLEDGAPLAADKTLESETICKKCREAWRKSEREGMAEAWEKLPSCFSLGTWMDLRNEDKRISSQKGQTANQHGTDNGNMASQE